MATIPNEELAIDRWPEVSNRTGYKSKSHVEQLEKKGLYLERGKRISCNVLRMLLRAIAKESFYLVYCQSYFWVEHLLYHNFLYLCITRG